MFCCYFSFFRRFFATGIGFRSQNLCLAINNKPLLLSDLLLFASPKPKRTVLKANETKNGVEGGVKCGIFYSFFHTDELFGGMMNSTEKITHTSELNCKAGKKPFVRRCSLLFFFFFEMVVQCQQ